MNMPTKKLKWIRTVYDYLGTEHARLIIKYKVHEERGISKQDLNTHYEEILSQLIMRNIS